MRLFALALLVSPALAAQPLAPEDSLLVRQLISASHVQELANATRDQFAANETAGFLGDVVFESYSPAATIDSVAAAFLRDFDREKVKAALFAFIDDEVSALLALQQGMGLPDMGFAIREIDVDHSTLADSVLVLDLVHASGGVDFMSDIFTAMMTRMMRVVPGGEEEAALAGMTISEYTDDFAEQQMGEILDTLVWTSRYAYRNTPPEAILRLAAFYKTPPGTYYTATAHRGMAASLTPVLNRYMNLMVALRYPEILTEDCPDNPDQCEASGASPSGQDD